MRIERWNAIPSYPGYEVSDFGRVRSRKKPGPPDGQLKDHAHPLTPWRDQKGYLFVCLPGRRRIGIHRLVLCAFIGPAPIGHFAAHWNGVSSDNRLENLRWATPKENETDKQRHGTVARGSRQGKSKLNEAQVREMFELSKELKNRILAIKFCISEAQVSRILARKRWGWL